MFIKPFRYHRVESLAEGAEALRSANGDTRVIAGGQSLLPMMNLGLVELDTVIDISQVRDARAIVAEDGYLRVEALVRHRDLETDAIVAAQQPMLRKAAGLIGNSRVRMRGTVGGSLAHCDPAAELPVAMVALGAEYEITDGQRIRTVRADEFHISHFTSSLDDAELLLAVRVPALGPGWGWGFQEFSRRKGDFAVVLAAALVRVAEGEIVEARLALGGVAGRPVRLGAVESSLTGARVEDVPARIARIEGLQPIGDTNATAQYRRHLARVLSIRALTDACKRGEETP